MFGHALQCSGTAAYKRSRLVLVCDKDCLGNFLFIVDVCFFVLYIYIEVIFFFKILLFYSFFVLLEIKIFVGYSI